jgi:hypothetical protein
MEANVSAPAEFGPFLASDGAVVGSTAHAKSGNREARPRVSMEHGPA